MTTLDRARRAAGTLSWGAVDQLLSALSNITITIAIARGAGIDGLGRFSIAFAAYLTVLGFARALVSEPMLTLPRGADDRQIERAGVTGTLLCAGLGGLVVAGAGVLLGRVELVVVAVALPVVLLQDQLRYQAFRRQQPQLAALLDGGWLLGSLLAWPLVSTSPSPALALICWAVAALLGVVLAARAVRFRLLGPRAALAWWRRDCRGVALSLVVDSLLVTLSLQVLVYLLVSTEGEQALGLLRAAQVYFGPLSTVFTALGVLAVPHLVQRARTVSSALAFRISAAMAVLACVVSAVVILAEPVLHTLLYAGTVNAPRWLLAPLAAQVVVSAAAGGLIMATKARRRGGDIAFSRLSSTVLGLILLVPATLTFGLQGAAWALVAQGLIYGVDLCLRVQRTGRRTSEPIST